jgi:tetratricopeptide (TPR) repeat protein
MFMFLICRKLARSHRIQILALLAISWWVLQRCGPASSADQKVADRQEGERFLNLYDSAGYVGKEICGSCHADIYASFMQTGMGRSFGPADLIHSRADWDGQHVVYDSLNDLHYMPFRVDSSLYLREFRLQGMDTVHNRIEKISYVVGSGQHTNSHLISIGGYLYQMPVTYYTQKGYWDLPPGFERGNNTRFGRAILSECISCHNAYPEQVQGSEHKYARIPSGIDCERCHGPGRLHVEGIRTGTLVDTSDGPDYRIVNPRRLPVSLQMSICQRCHLQGNAVLKPGKDFTSFRPGMHLDEVFSVFLPRYEGEEEHFTMASHPDRLMQSECYKQSAGSLSCISCHNPHKSVESTPASHYRTACQSCHAQPDACSAPVKDRKARDNDCASCHMQKTGTSDIPHVSITDHKIRVYRGDARSKSLAKGRFVGLASINEPNPDALTRAKAWLQQYERFDPQPAFLDSAGFWLKEMNPDRDSLSWLTTSIHLTFLRHDRTGAARLAMRYGNWLGRLDAWSAYRMGEMLLEEGNLELSQSYLSLAVMLMPYQLDFRLKLALADLNRGEVQKCTTRLEDLLREQPLYVPAMTNLGYLNLRAGDDRKAEYWYRKALALEPDNPSARMNFIGLLLYRKQTQEALVALDGFLKRYPGHPGAVELQRSLRSAS